MLSPVEVPTSGTGPPLTLLVAWAQRLLWAENEANINHQRKSIFIADGAQGLLPHWTLIGSFFHCHILSFSEMKSKFYGQRRKLLLEVVPGMRMQELGVQRQTREAESREQGQQKPQGLVTKCPHGLVFLRRTVTQNF